MRSASFLGSFTFALSSRGRRSDFPISEVPNIAIKEFTFLKPCHVHSISLKMADLGEYRVSWYATFFRNGSTPFWRGMHLISVISTRSMYTLPKCGFQISCFITGIVLKFTISSPRGIKKTSPLLNTLYLINILLKWGPGKVPRSLRMCQRPVFIKHSLYGLLKSTSWPYKKNF